MHSERPQWRVGRAYSSFWSRPQLGTVQWLKTARARLARGPGLFRLVLVRMAPERHVPFSLGPVRASSGPRRAAGEAPAAATTAAAVEDGGPVRAKVPTGPSRHRQGRGAVSLAAAPVQDEG
jgi:hypothetical protein